VPCVVMTLLYAVMEGAASGIFNFFSIFIFGFLSFRHIYMEPGPRWAALLVQIWPRRPVHALIPPVCAHEEQTRVFLPAKSAKKTRNGEEA